MVQRDQWDTYWGPKKGIFLIRNKDDRDHGGRVGGILSIRGPEVSPGSPRVGTIHVQTPTPHARALPSVDIYGNSLSQTSGQGPSPPSFGSRALWRAPSTGACGVGYYGIIFALQTSLYSPLGPLRAIRGGKRHGESVTKQFTRAHLPHRTRVPAADPRVVSSPQHGAIRLSPNPSTRWQSSPGRSPARRGAERRRDRRGAAP